MSILCFSLFWVPATWMQWCRKLEISNSGILTSELFWMQYKSCDHVQRHLSLLMLITIFPSVRQLTKFKHPPETMIGSLTRRATKWSLMRLVRSFDLHFFFEVPFVVIKSTCSNWLTECSWCVTMISSGAFTQEINTDINTMFYNHVYMA